mmetsp:Transcript_11830/g.32765  ORF Transcript_11830/g.32765 Transcript_11830/m.32765 type:complete len:302 (-) Transcript_11830:595-1500(-)
MRTLAPTLPSGSSPPALAASLSSLEPPGRTSVKSSASCPPSAGTTAPLRISPSSGSELWPLGSTRTFAAGWEIRRGRPARSSSATRSATRLNTALAPAAAAASLLAHTTTSTPAGVHRIFDPVSACSFRIVAPPLPMTPPMCPRVSTWHSHHLGPNFSHRPKSFTLGGPTLLLLLLLLLFIGAGSSIRRSSPRCPTSFRGSGVHPGAATHGTHRGLSRFLGQSCRCVADSALERKVMGLPRSALRASVSMTSRASPSVANCANAMTVPLWLRISCVRSTAPALTRRFTKSLSTLWGFVSGG